MGTLVRFPKSKQQPKKVRLEDFFLQRLPDHQQHCDMGDVRFTCASCGTTARFSFSGAIFSDCSFYCSSCGVGYKLSNPLFGRNSNGKNQKNGK